MSDIYQQSGTFKNFEILFKDSDDEVQKINCDVKSIESSYIIVFADNSLNNNLIIKEGSKVKIFVYTENGIYSSDSEVLEVSKNSIVTSYTLSYPENSKHSQRREFFRAEMCIPVSIKVVLNSLNNESYTIKTHTRNVCGNGICFDSEQQIQNYETILVSLSFSEKNIETQAKLVYSKEKPTKKRTLFTNALTFPSIKGQDTDFIVKNCFLYQLKCKNME